jgi:hypothetical protein
VRLIEWQTQSLGEFLFWDEVKSMQIFTDLLKLLKKINGKINMIVNFF